MGATEDKRFLSTRRIPPAERLIVALDVPDREQASGIVRQLGDAVRFYKLGLELFSTRDGFPLLDELCGMGKRVFADLKLFDVGETVARAVRNLRGRDGLFLTVHAYDAALRAAVRERGGVEILAVTLLTSMDKQDLVEEGFAETVEVEEVVLARARRALEIGCDGVVASAREARLLRTELGGDFLIVAPGIRPVGSRPDDQKRTLAPREALLSGADYIVVGRPIRDAAEGPRAAAERIQAEIAELFTDSP